MQALIDANELDIVSLRKNDFCMYLGIAHDKIYILIFVMKLKAVRMFDDISGYGEQSIEYLCSIIKTVEKTGTDIESSANTAESELVALTEQVIGVITDDTCEIIDGVSYKESIYSGKWAIVSNL